MVSRDGLLVCGVHIDGSFKMWDHRKNFVNVALNVSSFYKLNILGENEKKNIV